MQRGFAGLSVTPQALRKSVQMTSFGLHRSRSAEAINRLVCCRVGAMSLYRCLVSVEFALKWNSSTNPQPSAGVVCACTLA